MFKTKTELLAALLQHPEFDDFQKKIEADYFSGSIHTHSEFSRYDSTSSVSDIAKRASEMGAKHMALTDHGTAIGVWNFRDACAKYGIDGKPCAEEYFMSGDSTDAEDDASEDGGEDTIGKREHLVLLPKDNIGWHALSKIITASNKNIIGGKPIVTEEMLREWIGPGSEAHGHIFGTSACMIGVLCSKLLINKTIDEKQKKLGKERERRGLVEDTALIEAVKKLQEEIEDIKNQRSAAKTIADKTYKARLSKAEKSGDAEAVAAINAEIAESEQAKKDVARLQTLMLEKRNTLKPLKERLDKELPKYEKHRLITAEIAALDKMRVSDKEARNSAVKTLEKFNDIFGQENFFVEVQNHGIPEEKFAMPIVAEIAKEKGNRLIASNDVHIIYKEDAEARACIFAQKYFWKDISESDKELYMKNDTELAQALFEILPIEYVVEAISNIEIVLSQCAVDFPYESHAPKFICHEESAEIYMIKRIMAGKSKVEKWTKEYDERLSYELRTIRSMGFLDYLDIVEDFLAYGSLIGKINLKDERFLSDPFNLELCRKLAEENVGEGTGIGRGSAVGSLVCYLLGITNLDPIKYNLLFERFLNPERVTMPDIDSDFATDVRGWVIEYVKNKYGEKAVCQIMTQGFLAAKASIRAAVRIYLSKINIDKNLEPKKYDEIMNLGSELSDPIELNETINDAWDRLSPIVSQSEVASELIRIARLIEGKFTNIGKHAAGVIISDNEDVSDYVPMINVDGAMASQCDKDRTEALGMLKMDFLGLKNLSILTDCERAIFKKTGKKISMHDLPFEKEVFEKIFAAGNTDNVFQFESDGMKRVLTGFKPDCFEDLILLVALYRPGPAQYIDYITNVKHGKESPKYIIPEMEEVLGPTYGKPVYQEQIQQIFNKFAGFSLGKADIIRRHMAKKHYDEFAAYKEEFVEGMMKRGATPKDVEGFWNELLDFAAYAFNKSHAAAYAYTAYATAWFKYHYPAEYAIGCLNYDSNDHIELSLRNIKSSGVEILCPDVNKAEENFSVYGDSVVFGLSSVKQMTGSAADVVKERVENGRFQSFEDFLLRTNVKKDGIINLIYAGAFDEFSKNRQYMEDEFERMAPIIKKIKEKNKKLTEENDLTKIERLKKSIDEYTLQLADHIDPVYFDVLKSLKNEKDALGYYISQNPLDTVKTPTGSDIVPITKANTGKKCKIFGLVENYETFTTKSGKQMASFSLVDKTGTMKCCIFSKDFGKIKVEDSSFAVINGYFKNDCFVVNSAEKYNDKEGVFAQVNCESVEKWHELEKHVSNYTCSNGEGYPLKVCVLMGGVRKYLDTDYYVRKDIEMDPKFK